MPIYLQDNNLEVEQLDNVLSLRRDFEATMVSVFFLACVGLHTDMLALAVPQRGVKSVFYHVWRPCDSFGSWKGGEVEHGE